MARKRKSASKGDRNGAKLSFYAKALDEAEELDFEVAQGVEGIDDEIALLRVKIKSLLENDPENVRLIMEATRTLARLLRTRYNLEKSQGKGIKDAIEKVITELAVPLGVAVITKKL